MAISTIGVGGDFASPSLWEASLAAALVEDEIARILDDLSSLSDIEKTFDINIQTSASAKIIIETWDGVSGTSRVQDFKAGNGNIPVIKFGRGGSYGIVTRRAGCNHLIIRHLTVECTNSGSNFVLDVRGSVPTDNLTTIHNNYFFVQDEVNHNGAIDVDSGTKGAVFDNIMVTGQANALAMSGAELSVYNNTFVGTFSDIDMLRAGIRYGNGSTERNAVFNYGPTSGYKDYLNNAPVFNENASSDTSGSVGFQNLNVLDQYTDPANHDWTFKAGNSLEGAATGGQNIGITVGGVTPPEPSAYSTYWTQNFSGVI